MSIEARIPRIGGGEEAVTLAPGAPLLLLGGNGVGKSALVTWLARRDNCVWVRANRPNTFHTGEVSLTARQAAHMRVLDAGERKGASARYWSGYSGDPASLALFDFVRAEMLRNRRIAEIADAAVPGNSAENAARRDLPFSRRLTAILAEAAIPVEIGIDGLAAVQARRDGGAPFDAAQLSDGQRAALLLAAEILTAHEGWLLVIDEPERHLNPAITTPLLTRLLAERPDCPVVISTHDLAFATALGAQALILRDVDLQREAWDFDVLPAGSDLPDDLRRDVLGAKPRILYVEGRADGDDERLYAVLFPEMRFVARASCGEVHRAVAVLGDAPLAWVAATGLVDGDGRTEAEREALGDRVTALRVADVEALYCHPDLIHAVARHLAVDHPEEVTANAVTAMIAAFERARPGLVDHFIRGAAHRALDRRIVSATKEIEGEMLNLSVDLAPIRARAEAPFSTGCADPRAHQRALMACLSSKRAGLRKVVARALGGEVTGYRSVALAVLRDDPDLRGTLRAEVGA